MSMKYSELNKTFLSKKKKGGFVPMNYGALTFFSHELSTMTLDPIKLPSYDTFLPFLSQMDN